MARYADKTKKRKAPPPRSSRDLALCKRLGIDPKRLLDPEFKAKVDQYWKDVKAAFSEPIDLGDVDFKNPPGAVQGARVANRMCDKKVIHDAGGVR